MKSILINYNGSLFLNLIKNEKQFNLIIVCFELKFIFSDNNRNTLIVRTQNWKHS